MDRLQGYNTNGHEYRASIIDRNNTQRLKWLMKTAKENVEKNENNLKNNNQNNNTQQQIIPNKNTMFNPANINKFKNNGFK